MVRERLEPVRLLHNRDSNYRPRSVTMVDGTPNREIQPLRNTFATASVVASGHRVNRSTQVRKKVCGWSNQVYVDDIKMVVRC